MSKSDSGCCTPFLKALGDKTRWRLVQELLAGPGTVSELAERLGASQYNISKHLRILREVGIVEALRRGKRVHCRIAPSFQSRVAKNKNQLDLGCCVFRFKKSPH
ncbi:MAG TPA: metalloregulator ArsR/SmtB family transcription factor [Candidatus Cybelea sp.]|jgi:DNA-binding transcriptional ArsR family regulator|nr:metalloregulator ArsR/SmtB family transcription factor [Candidatus Cybelea sp.]